MPFYRACLLDKQGMRHGRRNLPDNKTSKTSKSKKHHPEKSNPLPGIPESQNRSSTGPVPSLVVVIIHKDQGSVRRHKAPAFSPAPSQKHRLEATLSIGESSESWISCSIFILTLSRPSFLRPTCGSLSPVWHCI